MPTTSKMALVRGQSPGPVRKSRRGPTLPSAPLTRSKGKTPGVVSPFEVEARLAGPFRVPAPLGPRTDAYERQAEQLSTLVDDPTARRGTDWPAVGEMPQSGFRVQRMCSSCAEEEEETTGLGVGLGSRSCCAGERTAADRGDWDALTTGGRPLSDADRRFFEPRFGYDLGAMRLHTGPVAARLARHVGARAFTLGSHIVVGASRTSGAAPIDRRLLAHELTHAIQQGGGVPIPGHQHRSAGGRSGPGDANPAVSIEALGSGQPLDPGVRSSMESAFGQGFGHVRIHTGEDAAQTADRLGGDAITKGFHIVFARGRYRPGTLLGDALIAHELAHVAQQSAATPRVALSGQQDSGSEAALEHDADRSVLHAMVARWGHLVGLKPKESAAPRLRSSVRLSFADCFSSKRKAQAGLTCQQVCDVAYGDSSLNAGGGGVVCNGTQKCACVFDVPPATRGECPELDKIVMTHETRHLPEVKCDDAEHMYRGEASSVADLIKVECTHRKESIAEMDTAIAGAKEPCKTKMTQIRADLDTWVKANCGP